ncbi:electron transport complex subunit RsxG [Erwinia psidii]|uniref:Ion-translocating oxidoreductase complex subunit G n=1 Tax=Erwinia psidii TaxID=69224 RepID=A0A3N6S0N3_9GAMM|nr:electron transport complex subunit RsxG [Erwinia psidii]MCX8956085.1 electron transport complex subunit RsxG [Erwinia psidii]MCX8960148.1 electron transport complex subunit RsxG [Erwinia psidii]MCX8963695.1 electron transport complex subunit RsxG [Erwinia psidii]RQM39064.1 electron transport complex subunit RsxG [Erwinia psidii]
MLDAIRKNGVTLAIFAAVTTGLTAVINAVTKPTIAHQTALQQKVLLDQVVPPERYNNAIQKECYSVTDPALGNASPHRLYLARKNDQPVAVAIETTAPDGYSGAIQMIVGADFSGKVLGVRVVEHHETPGLGDKIELRISEWINSFNGVQIKGKNDTQFAVKKDGGSFDQFTGATITPRAVVNAAKRTTLFVETLPQRLDSLPACGEKNE